MISAKQLIEEANINNAEKTNYVNNLIFIKKLIQLSATPRTKKHCEIKLCGVEEGIQKRCGVDFFLFPIVRFWTTW